MSPKTTGEQSVDRRRRIDSHSLAHHSSNMKKMGTSAVGLLAAWIAVLWAPPSPFASAFSYPSSAPSLSLSATRGHRAYLIAPAICGSRGLQRASPSLLASSSSVSASRGDAGVPPRTRTAFKNVAENVLQPISSLSLFVASDVLLRRAFGAAGVVFPSSLAGMLLLFVALVAFKSVLPKVADGAVRMLEPGAQLLTKWLPIFFVPSLIVLPLASPLSRGDSLKVPLLIVAGWIASLLSSASVASALRSSGGKTPAASLPKPAASTRSGPATPSQTKILAGATAASAGVVFAATRALVSSPPGVMSVPVQCARTLFMLLSTLLGYLLGTFLPHTMRNFVHPLLTCTAFTWLAAWVATALSPGLAVGDILRQYITASKCPVHLGAGDLLLCLLGPSVISFAMQMYGRRRLMAENAPVILGTTTFGSVTGLFGTAAASNVLGISPVLRLASLSRNITSPLAIAIAAAIGANASLAVALVVITGILGANFGAKLLDATGLVQGFGSFACISDLANVSALLLFSRSTAGLRIRLPGALPWVFRRMD
jgi:putative effector of murein hydrolase/putative effector of murein hydrolase LrgA (UPF0299 family)